MRSTAVKRIMQEAAELAREAEGDRDFAAAPLEVRGLHFNVRLTNGCRRIFLIGTVLSGE